MNHPKKIKCTYGKIESKIESNNIQKLIKNLVNNKTTLKLKEVLNFKKLRIRNTNMLKTKH